MIIGTFEQANDVYIGNVPVLTGFPVRIAPTKRKGVDYEVTIGITGIELGVAWKKTSSKGKEYLSLKLDSPCWSAPVNCALVKQTDGSQTLVWNRDKPKADEEPAAA